MWLLLSLRVRAIVVLISVLYLEMSVILLANCDAGATFLPQANIQQTNKNLITTRFGVLHCRAKAQPRQTESSGDSFATKTIDSEKLKSQADREESPSAGNNHGPKVIILPPIQEENENSSEPPDSGELEEEFDQATGEEQNSVEDGRRTRRSEQKGSLWQHIGRRLSQSRAGLKRHRRQTADSLLEEAAREVLGLRPRTRPNQLLLTPELMQQLVNSVLLVVQQFFSIFVGRNVADLPLRMANFGQLVANIITALTVNNPVLVNSPLLRNTQSMRQFNLTTTGGDAVSSLNNFLDAAGGLLRVLNAANSTANRVFSQPDSRTTVRPTPAADTNNTTESDSESSNNETTSLVKDSSRADDAKEIEFVNRLNELTSSSLRQSVDRLTDSQMKKKKKNNNNNNKNTKMKRKSGAKLRQKRSIASLLMFGPFSKFYMAMVLNRMLKYQSSVVSQAVMGELVRRFVMPTLTSALAPAWGQPGGGSGAANSLASLGGAFNQVRQSLAGAIAASPSFANQPSQLLALPSNIKQQKFTNQEQADDDNQMMTKSSTNPQKLDPSTLLFDADCQLVSDHQPRQLNQSAATSSLVGLTDFATAMIAQPVMSRPLKIGGEKSKFSMIGRLKFRPDHGFERDPGLHSRVFNYFGAREMSFSTDCAAIARFTCLVHRL